MRLRASKTGVIVALAAVLIAAGAPAALAAADLEEYLQHAEDAEYAGRRIVITVWDGTSRISIYDVTHAPSLMMIGDESGESTVGSGKVAGSRSAAVMIAHLSASGLANRYTVEAPKDVMLLGRSARSITIVEDALVRAVFVFDSGTGASLSTEIYDGAGTLFRYSAMLEFDPSPNLVYKDLQPATTDYDVMLPATGTSLPPTAAGYERADTYGGPNDSVHAFYTDGLFSFSIFEIRGDVHLTAFDDGDEFEVAGATYQRLITPSELWVAWSAHGSTYLLIGGLPPDHLEDVLVELPRPNRGNLLQRMWRGLFG